MQPVRNITRRGNILSTAENGIKMYLIQGTQERASERTRERGEVKERESNEFIAAELRARLRARYFRRDIDAVKSREWSHYSPLPPYVTRTVRFSRSRRTVSALGAHQLRAAIVTTITGFINEISLFGPTGN